MDLPKKIATLYIQSKSYDRVIYSPKAISSFRGVRQETPKSAVRKPNGLWYACDSSWKDFVQREGGWGGYRYKYLLEVNLNRMCVIRTEKELLDFNSKYGIEIRWSTGIDWLKVSKDYDGIEICPYQWNQRMELDWYYGWDVASGCIWGSGAFKNIEEVENDIYDNEKDF